MSRKGESKTSVRRLEGHARQLAALELRKAGLSFALIAQRVGYSDPSGAYRGIMAALRRTFQEPADEVRKLELERLDRLLNGIWSDAESGNKEAIDRALSIMRRRALYLGLDAPSKIEHRGEGGGPVRVIFEEKRNWRGNGDSNRDQDD